MVKVKLSGDVEVAYIPVDACCDLRPGNVDAWLDAILETNQTDYGGGDVPWWFTVEGGQITRIEEMSVRLGIGLARKGGRARTRAGAGPLPDAFGQRHRDRPAGRRGGRAGARLQ